MKFRQLRPSVETLFHVDWGWFDRNNIDAQSVIRNQLCYRCQQQFADGQEVAEVDHIDPETGEITRLDNLREAILAHCQWEPTYIDSEMPLLQGILRLFLASNNHPLSVLEMAQRLGRHDPETILRLLTARGVQSGIVQLRS